MSPERLSDDEFSRILVERVTSLNENEGVRMVSEGENTILQKLDPTRLANLATDEPDVLFIVGSMHRPGISAFVAALEHTHYTPDTPDNDKIALAFYRWEGLTWYVVCCPLEDRQLVESVAAEFDLSLGLGEVIFSLGDEGADSEFKGIPAKSFPLKGRNVAWLKGS